jgi:hypothetical protein
MVWVDLAFSWGGRGEKVRVARIRGERRRMRRGWRVMGSMI